MIRPTCWPDPRGCRLPPGSRPGTAWRWTGGRVRWSSRGLIPKWTNPGAGLPFFNLNLNGPVDSDGQNNGLMDEAGEAHRNLHAGMAETPLKTSVENQDHLRRAAPAR
jgi:hypothetical protein